MKTPDIIRRILHGEVDTVQRGTDRLLSMRERELAQQHEQEALRAQAHQEHPQLAIAVREHHLAQHASRLQATVERLRAK